MKSGNEYVSRGCAPYAVRMRLLFAAAETGTMKYGTYYFTRVLQTGARFFLLGIQTEEITTQKLKVADAGSGKSRYHLVSLKQ